MYYYILVCGIACLIFCGIGCMDTVDVKPGKVLLNSLIWPVALVAALVDHMDTNRAFRHVKAAR